MEQHSQYWPDEDSEEMQMGLDDSDELNAILEETRKEVISWMKTYGRGFIREWMADNAKGILASDGLLHQKKVKRQSATITSKTSGKKVPAKPLNVTQEIIHIE